MVFGLKDKSEKKGKKGMFRMIRCGNNFLVLGWWRKTIAIG